MWIRKSPAEISAEKRATLLRGTCLDVLLAAGLWYCLVRLSMFLGLVSRSSVSVYVGCAVITVFLPAAWYSTRRKRSNTMVCDRCNALKTADDQPNCNCGGQYYPLTEMKWVSNASSERTFMMTAEGHL